MPANTNPIFLLTPKVSWGTVSTANIGKDGTGTVTTIFTAGANGSRIEKIKFMHLGTNVASVARIFINNGNASSTPANNSLIAEITITSNTVNEAGAQDEIEVMFDGGLIIPANHKLNVSLGTTAAAGLQVTAFGGDF